MAARLGEDRQAASAILPSTPFEEVRDFFYANNNHIPELDEAAEAIATRMNFPIGQIAPVLAAYLEERHRVKVVLDAFDDIPSGTQRTFDAGTRVMHLSRRLRPGQQAFQFATQIAFLEFDDVLRSIVKKASFTNDEARGLARIGLANYFAGALVLPYTPFLNEAERWRYDIELLGHRFGVGFETVCHRLSTLQRPNARGVPFFFAFALIAPEISPSDSRPQTFISPVSGEPVRCGMFTKHSPARDVF